MKGFIINRSLFLALCLHILYPDLSFSKIPSATFVDKSKENSRHYSDINPEKNSDISNESRLNSEAPRIDIDTTRETPDIHNQKIGKQEFLGLKHTKHWVVERELHNKVGQEYSDTKWKKERAALMDLDLFSKIELDVINSDSTVTLQYRFFEILAYLPVIVVEKTDQDGWSAGPGLASVNLLGRDIRLEALSRFGGTTEYQFSLSSPWIVSLPIEYDLFAKRVDSYNSLDDFHELSDEFRLRLNERYLGQWRMTRGLESIFLADMLRLHSDRQGVQLSQGRSDLIPRLGAGLLWQNLDARINTTRGVRVEMEGKRSGGPLGGPSDYWEWTLDFRAYLPLWPFYLRHILQFSNLYQWRSGVLGENVPLYDRFHLGGVNSLRGYEPGTASGKSEWILNWEYRYKIGPPLHVMLWKWPTYFAFESVVGVDRAQVWKSSSWVGNQSFYGGYTGLHILTPGIERIRLELGSPAKRWQEANLALTFDIGLYEKSKSQRFAKR